jgi:hypothetical protein
MNKATRIYWHKFLKNHPDILHHIRRMLAHHGFELVFTFDNEVCTDVHIVKSK